MDVLIPILAVSTLAMLVLHLTSWKLVDLWNEGPQTGVGRWLGPTVVARVEALYWILVLIAWPLWPTSGVKWALGIFAGIHVLVWLGAEVRGLTDGAAGRSTGVGADEQDGEDGEEAVLLAGRFKSAVVVFDLVETVALAAVGWFVLSELAVSATLP